MREADREQPLTARGRTIGIYTHCKRGHDLSVWLRPNGEAKTKCGYCCMYRWDGQSPRICTVTGCDNWQSKKLAGVCATHYYRIRRHGDPLTLARAPHGAGYTNRHGYREIYAPDGRKMLEHRYVMEQQIGRALARHEHVHHVNGVRDDNRPDNLELWSTTQPAGQRVEDKIEWAKSFLANYGYRVVEG